MFEGPDLREDLIVLLLQVLHFVGKKSDLLQNERSVCTLGADALLYVLEFALYLQDGLLGQKWNFVVDELARGLAVHDLIGLTKLLEPQADHFRQLLFISRSTQNPSSSDSPPS